MAPHARVVMSRQYYSDLEVAPDLTTPEAYHEEKIAHYNNGTLPHAELSTEPHHQHELASSQKPSHQRTICGLSRQKAFWLALVLAVVVLVAVVGGAVGGTQAARSKDNDSDKTNNNNNTSDVPSSSTTPTARDQPTKTILTTTTQANPTQTLYRDCPSSNNTIYNALGSTAYQFRKFCNASFQWSAGAGGRNVVNQRTSSLNDCIDLCVAFNVKNRTEIAAGTSNACNGVCWRNDIGDPDWPGQCFGATIQNSSEAGFPVTRETICDSGAWVNQRLL
ncbi:hypothetical protein JDV02_007255 [Purpureocillium takamizusanense]|uniref:Uncharacterized protein n=1 Tax=Purpureocillium takamizusanense TaxID=2060973 RepID=A0A9Q8QK66_9HYPO|nr:uncharacterized protein JDV02_007255 [Purpureocillium takamizusanense]UNI21248.1 hypothetical protein JDV02_007255 [Purpureocillium takamizusanense]